MKAKYGNSSLKKLANKVDPRLVHFAMELERQSDLPCDLTIFETDRTMAQQKENVAKGVSKTLDSRHVRENNPSGLVEAVDIVAYVGGASWDLKYLKPINKIAERVIKNLGYQDIITIAGIAWGWDEAHYEIKKNARLK